MDFAELSYPQLKQECARRGLGGSGKAPVLLERLLNDSPNPQQDPDRGKPTFSNYDKDGNWIRRPKGFVSWEDEEKKWEAQHA